MSEKISFKKKIGGNLKVQKNKVVRVKRVNGACSDLVLRGGQEVRVKGSYSKTLEELDIELKPEGIKKYKYRDR